MDSQENYKYSLTEKEEAELDAKLNQWLLEYSEEFKKDSERDDWVHITIAMPKNFFDIYMETLNNYKLLRETDKTFPAFEAMVMEAKNSIH